LFKPAAPSGREIRRRSLLHHGPRQPSLYVLLGTVKLTKEVGDFSRQTANHVSFFGFRTLCTLEKWSVVNFKFII
jgi:hypothetical protein